MLATQELTIEPTHQSTVLPHVLLVDDDDSVRESLELVLKHSRFHVTVAANVKQALHLIATQRFDVLLSDLHMPQAGDGLTVVSAMRHSNPKAVTIIFSGYPQMREAAAAILLQADEILVKPMAPRLLVDTIRQRLAAGAATGPRRVGESVAAILEEKTQEAISDWLAHVDRAPEIITVPLSKTDRCAHLPQLFEDLVYRLRNPLPLGSRALTSPSAAAHGFNRRRQGYTAAMVVEESRMLQVSIFETLQNNLHQLDFSLLLLGVVTIADEVDSQLAQAMTSYVAESKLDALPMVA